jgi:RNA polymerase sigma-70 factor (ECF subfamily)
LECFSQEDYIRRFLSGDKDAFNFIVRIWQTQIYQLAYRYMGNEQDAKDVCQNAFIKAYKNVKKLKNETSFSGWIYKIAINLCKDELKKKKKAIHTDIDNIHNNEFVYEEVITVNPKCEENIMKEDMQNIIKRTILNLPEEQKIIVILKEYQGLKFKEIAEILNIPENTAKSRMYYALKNIKNILEKQNFDKEVY